MTAKRRHLIRNVSLGLVLLIVGITTPLTITKGNEVVGGNRTLVAIWVAAALIGGAWLIATDLISSRLPGIWARVMSLVPSFRFAKSSDSWVFAVTKPSRFVSAEPTVPEPAHDDPQEGALARSLMWIGELSAAEARGIELQAKLLEARRSPSSTPFPPNGHLLPIASQIKKWNLNVADIVDRSRLSQEAKIGFPIFASQMIGAPPAGTLSKLIDIGLSHLRLLRADRSFDP